MFGDQAGDFLGVDSVTALASSNFVVASLFDDDGPNVNVGSVYLLNGGTGAPIGATIRGLSAFDFLDVRIVTPENGGYFIFAAPDFDNGAGVNSGFVGLVAE